MVCPGLGLRVLGAVRFPFRVSDWSALALDKTVFLHSQAPKGWWEEWSSKLDRSLPVAYPIGADRWGYEVFLQHGVRDGVLCPVGGRWLVIFWSSKPLSQTVTSTLRVMIYAMASFAAMRLDQLVGARGKGTNVPVRLTPRELAVLRLLSFGAPSNEIAMHLGLGEETVRSHAKRAQMKLGATSRTHAVAEAIRQHLLA
jgi:LuxR family quorum sensing-dependent transcriptional regulator